MRLELIHSDVLGPDRASSRGYKYYVSFIDDYSHLCWIYLLKHKSDVEQVFCTFQDHVEHLLNTKIKAPIRVVSIITCITIFSVLASIIYHRVSCPHTSQQNGIAECKHRHLVETDLSLLAHSSVPLHYSDEAFLTACYLINCMPTSVLHQDTPISSLLKIQPGYSFLCVLGVRAGLACVSTTHISCPFARRDSTWRPKEYTDGTVRYSPTHRAFFATPSSHRDALDEPTWRVAMTYEFDVLQRTNTWVLVPRPSRVNIVGNKWIFKTKQRPDGSVDKY
jgi:hypothetical protein